MVNFRMSFKSGFQKCRCWNVLYPIKKNICYMRIFLLGGARGGSAPGSTPLLGSGKPPTEAGRAPGAGLPLSLLSCSVDHRFGRRAV
jgi:hypothetical protein